MGGGGGEGGAEGAARGGKGEEETTGLSPTVFKSLGPVEQRRRRKS